MEIDFAMTVIVSILRLPFIMLSNADLYISKQEGMRVARSTETERLKLEWGLSLLPSHQEATGYYRKHPSVQDPHSREI